MEERKVTCEKDVKYHPERPSIYLAIENLSFHEELWCHVRQGTTCVLAAGHHFIKKIMAKSKVSDTQLSDLHSLVVIYENVIKL